MTQSKITPNPSMNFAVSVEPPDFRAPLAPTLTVFEDASPALPPVGGMIFRSFKYLSQSLTGGSYPAFLVD